MFEEKRREPKNYKKIARRILEIIILSLILIWGILLLTNYIRYTKDLPPLIVVDKNTYNYEDGRVIEYVSLGYIYREYERVSSTRTEFVPYWKEVIDYEITNYFPELREHQIPNNPDREEIKNNVIFFFDDDDEILFTYRCFNINNCDIATSYGNTEKMARFNNYVFIEEEYEEKDVVYIIDINKKEIVYEAQYVKHSLVDDLGNGLTNDGELIVIDQEGRYGVLYLTDEVIELAAPNYGSISYNTQSDTYTMQSKYWLIKDLTNDEVLFTSERELIDAFRVNGKLYMEYLIPVVLTDLQILEGLTIEDFPKTYNVMDESDYDIFEDDYYDIEYINDKFFLIDDNKKLYIKDEFDNNIIISPISLKLNVEDEKYKEPYRTYVVNDKFVIDVIDSLNRVDETYIYELATWNRLR